jgi:hypothetical protein
MTWRARSPTVDVCQVMGNLHSNAHARSSPKLASPIRIVKPFSIIVSIRRFTSALRRDGCRDAAKNTFVLLVFNALAALAPKSSPNCAGRHLASREPTLLTV